MKSRLPLLALAITLVAATPAQAAPVLFSATLRIDIIGLAPVVVSDVGSIDVSGGTYSIAASFVSEPGPLVIPLTAATLIHSLRGIGIENLAGTLSLGGATLQNPAEVCIAPGLDEACVVGGGIGGAMALTGVIEVHVVEDLVVIPIDLFGLGIGQGVSGATPFTYEAGLWTTRTAMINTGLNVITTQGGTTVGGGITLVTGTFIAACGNILPTFTSLTLTPIVPEPAVLALLGAGLLGLLGLRGRG